MARHKMARAGAKHDKGKGGKRPSGSKGGPGMHARGTPTGKHKGHGGGKSVASPGAKVGAYKSGHDATHGRAARQAEPRGNIGKLTEGAGTKVDQGKARAREKRLGNQYL